MMEIDFQTKEESNEQQLSRFLKLSKSERIYNFLNLAFKVNQYPIKEKTDKKSSNFIIQIKSKKSQ